MADGGSEQPKNSQGRAERVKAYCFKPGQSGNPGGRPRTRFISQALRASLESGDADAIAAVLVKLARKGNVSAIREIADRTEGKPQESVTLNGNLSVDLATRRERIRELLNAVRGKSG